MKRIYLVLAFAILTLGLAACGSNGSNNKKADMHTSENSLDFYGVYEGMLPAADAEGIKTKLTLNRDKTFVLQTQYVGKSDRVFEESGKFSVKDGSIVQLNLNSDGMDTYKIEEGRLRMLDTDMKVIKGDLADHYILKQTVVQE